MDQSAIVERAAAIAELPAFAMTTWWLTFYLCGDPETLHRVGVALSERGAVNTGDGQGGFLYPKLEVRNDPMSVARLVHEIRQLVQTAGADVIAVDVDSSPFVELSRFEELARYQGDVL